MIKYTIKPRRNVANGTVKFYPTIVSVTPMRLSGVIEQVEKQCTVSSADIKAVIDALEDVIVSAVKNGLSVRLGDLGSFRPTLSTSGQTERALVTAADIKRVRVRFTPSGSLARKLRKDNVELGLAGETEPTEEEGA